MFKLGHIEASVAVIGLLIGVLAWRYPVQLETETKDLALEEGLTEKFLSPRYDGTEVVDSQLSRIASLLRNAGMGDNESNDVITGLKRNIAKIDLTSQVTEALIFAKEILSDSEYTTGITEIFVTGTTGPIIELMSQNFEQREGNTEETVIFHKSIGALAYLLDEEMSKIAYENSQLAGSNIQTPEVLISNHNDWNSNTTLLEALSPSTQEKSTVLLRVPLP